MNSVSKLNLARALVLLLLPVTQGAVGETGQPEAQIERPASATGFPWWIQLGEGSEQRVTYRGPASRALVDRGRAVPMVLASGDFDQDGIPDLAAGYGMGWSGLVAVHFGRLEPVFPHRMAAALGTHPFAESARVLELPIALDRLFTGDFDADGRVDLVAAATGHSNVHLLLGNGSGGFPRHRTLTLDGRLTALAVGEFGRTDGLPDVAIGLSGPSGTEVRIFLSREFPREGLLEQEPVRVELPDAPSALVFAELTGDHLSDLAIGVGSELWTVEGRDSKIRVDHEAPDEPPPIVHRRATLPAQVVALTAGRFRGPALGLAALDERGRVHWLDREAQATEVSVLPAEAVPGAALVRAVVSSLPGDDLLVVDRHNRKVHIMSAPTISAPDPPFAFSLDVDGSPRAVLPMRLNEDGLSDLVMLFEGRSTPVVALTAAGAVFVVDSAGDSSDSTPGDGSCVDTAGECTLRAAIEEANAVAGADQVQFSSSFTIPVSLGPLPVITDPLSILGDTGGPGRIELDGSGASAGATGLQLGPGSSGSVLRSLVINRFSGEGVRIESADNRVEDCYIGTDSIGGSTVAGNAGAGVLITGAAVSGNTIGGSTVAHRNVISGNGVEGVRIELGASGNTVAGNFVGTDVFGLVAHGNGTHGIGLRTGATMNLVGGTALAPGQPPGNLISGNGTGVNLRETGTSGNQVHGNLIGTDGSGTEAIGNVSGVGLGRGPSSNTIGGSSVALRNVISGNSSIGMTLAGDFFSPVELNVIQGNYIGTDVSGLLTLANGDRGISISSDTRDTMIGGLTSQPGMPPGNVISGNGSDGIRIASIRTNGNAICGNLIGLDSPGMTTLSNVASGILVSRADNNLIGGSSPGAGNVISGNGTESIKSGVEIDEARQVGIVGNLIGTDVAGSAGIGNGGDGVSIVDRANVSGMISDNRIGGAEPGEGNVISANGLSGVRLSGAAVVGNFVSGNLVGLDSAGTVSLGNASDGVLVTAGAAGNFIGGTTNSTPGACTGDCNVVAHNSFGSGVRIDGNDGTGNAIRGNSIFANGGLGIDLGPSGVTANDALDADVGANDLQNFPLIGSTSFDGSSTTISGTLDSIPDTGFTVDVFGNSATDSSGFGEGETYLGSATVLTDGAGDGSFTIVVPGAHGGISATATGPGNSTSEFGPVRVNLGESSLLSVSPGAGTALDVGYGRACLATDHAVYLGSGGPGPLSGSLVWTEAFCGLGDAGTTSFDPGTPSPGRFFYFVLVGQDSSSEGSYGRDSANAERPEAIGVGVCDLPRHTPPSCP